MAKAVALQKMVSLLNCAMAMLSLSGSHKHRQPMLTPSPFCSHTTT
jgi:hypothetical protein